MWVRSCAFCTFVSATPGCTHFPHNLWCNYTHYTYSDDALVIVLSKYKSPLLDLSPEDLALYGGGFRNIWNTNPYLDLEPSRTKKKIGALRFHRRKFIDYVFLMPRPSAYLSRTKSILKTK